MARLEIEIGGDASGLDGAVNKSLGILGKLQDAADKLNVQLFKAEDINSLMQVGEKLTTVTGYLKTYTDLALKSNTAFQDQQASATLDNLNGKLRAINGSAELFGTTLKTQQAEIRAYESAIAKLLNTGLEPTDSRITSLKKNIDDLNASMGRSKQSDMYRQFQDTGRIIPDLENKIKRLRTALSTATDTRGIVQYNLRLRQAQDELKRLQTLGVATATSTQSIGAALRNSAIDADRATRGYNAVSLEFGRIIQDAPFAANNFGAIGNNITRLTEVLPQYIAQSRATIAAQGGVATSANVLKTALSGLFTGFGGITLAISVAVSAYTFYQQHVQRTAREQKKLKDETQNYIDTLRGVDRARLEGTQNAQEELTSLRLLYAAYQDATLPIERRRDAYEQLQELFPEYFKNIAFEETATNQTKEAYDKLTNSILTTARARAAANIITKNSERQLENENKLLANSIKLQELDAKERAGLEKLDRAASADNIEGVAARESALRRDIEKQRTAILEENNSLGKEYNDLTSDNVRLQEEVNKLLAEGGSLVNVPDPKPQGPTKIEKPLYESPTSVALAGLEGVELELEKVRQKYLKFYNDLSEAATKKGADLAKINRLMVQAEADERVEANAIILAEEQRIASEIERIRTDSGIKATENRRKEILTVLKWYDEEIRKARGNAEILAAIEEGKHARINAINEKYLQQRLDAHDKIRDKIQALEDRPFRLNENNSRAARRAIEEDLRKRLKLVQDYYDELRKLHAGNVWAQAALFAEQANTEEGLKGGAATAAAGDFYKELSRATARFGREFYQTLTTINQMADKTFTSIFSKLVDGLNSAMEEIFLNQFQKKMSQAFDKASDDLGEKLTGAIAAVGLAGGIISGATNKTSGVGQGIGKGLQGAASGAMLGTAVMPGIGTAIGAAVGGIAGALSGIFSAKKARREEELQQQQLLEAQKQTKLLERQNALAYTASIIGRMTTEGVVTGVEINEFGQLTTKISGQDLLVVLDRANSSRLRGT